MKTREHVESFDNLYARLGDLNLAGIGFPLVEIEAFRWNRGPWNDAYFNYHYRRFTCHILSRLALQSNQSILILGCGFGLDEKNIRSLSAGTELWSVDVSRHMVGMAVASHSPSRFALALAENLPFPDRCFDRVLSREVIEHVISPEKMLKEIHRVLKPGGIAVVTTENEESLAPSNFFDWNMRSKAATLLGLPLPTLPYKDSAPSVAEMEAMTVAAGLELVEHVFDGALYKYLAEITPLLKTRAAGAAHFFSSLENNRLVGAAFCDQVKYVLRKRADERTAISAPRFACTLCRAPLTEGPGHWRCTGCDASYNAPGGVPDFLQQTGLEEAEQAGSQGAPQAGPGVTRRIAGKMFTALSRVFRGLYSFVYMTAAVLATTFSKKNRNRPSGLLSADDPLQQYLKC